MYEFLKAIAAGQDPIFGFFYAKHDYRNLFSEVEVKNRTQIFLDPVEIDDIMDEFNVVVGEIHSGAFMILLSSDIDEISYDDRYQKYIKPLIATQTKEIKEALRCTYKVQINNWKTIEVINMLDYNLDGLIVTYNITIDI